MGDVGYSATLPGPERRSLGRRVQSLAAPAAALLAFALMGWVNGWNDYLGAALWVTVLLASAVGWGALALSLTRARVCDWGMCLAVGLAVHLAIGGVLELFALASVRSCTAVALAGVLAWAAARWRTARAGETNAQPRATGTAALIMPALYVAASFACLASLADQTFNPYDDHVAYFEFPKQILGTGTLFEPFSQRRVSSYGGQSYLHALVVAYASIERLHVVDRGISVVALLGLLVGFGRERRLSPAAIALPALLVLARDPLPANTASTLSGAVFAFASFRIVASRTDAEGTARGWAAGDALLLGILAGAFATLRQNYLVPAFLFPMLWFAYRAALDRRGRALWLRDASLAAAFALLFLLPWAILAYRSAHTPLFPLVAGDARPDFSLAMPTTLAETAQLFLLSSISWSIFPELWILGVAAALTKRAAPLKLLLASTVVSFATLVYTLRASDDVPNIVRYFVSVELAFVLAATVLALSMEGPRKRLVRGLVAFAIVAHLGVELIVRPTLLHLGWGAAAIAAELSPKVREQRQNSEDGANAAYRAIQESTAPGAAILVLLDEPYRFDFARNPIVNFDMPGAVSPAPHLPIGEGPEALAKYLSSVGLRYVAFAVREDSFLYQRGLWETHALNPVPPRDGTTLGALLKAQAPFYLDVFDNLEALAKTRVNVFADGPTHVLESRHEGRLGHRPVDGKSATSSGRTGATTFTTVWFKGTPRSFEAPSTQASAARPASLAISRRATTRAISKRPRRASPLPHAARPRPSWSLALRRATCARVSAPSMHATSAVTPEARASLKSVRTRPTVPSIPARAPLASASERAASSSSARFARLSAPSSG